MLTRATAKALIPAAILTALVLFVFSTLQNFGPESAVRKFHEAASNLNESEIKESIVQPSNPQEVREVRFIVNQFIRTLPPDSTFSLRDLASNRTAKSVTVTVIYRSNGRTIRAADWVAVKSPYGWRVDTHKTLVRWNQLIRSIPTEPL